MKIRRAMIALIAGVTALAPLAATPAFAQRGDRQEQNDRRGDARAEQWREDRREDRRDALHRGWRDDRRDARWDRGQHNGYWSNGRFYRGQPSRAQRRASDFGYGYHEYRRGERLSSSERRNYHHVSDYRGHNLRAPPRGYEWRRSNTGDYILAALATGVILSVILANN